MTSLELFNALGSINAENLAGADALQWKTQPHISHRRALSRAALIAAIIAVTVLLVGCTAAILLHLDRLRFNEVTYTENMRYEKDGSTIPSTEKIMEYISIVGPEGSSSQLAAREWLDYTQHYDAEGTRRQEGFQKPSAYNSYADAYTADMLDKIDELCSRYGLKLAGDVAIYQGNDSAFLTEVLHFDSVVKKDSGLEAELGGARITACGDFNASYQATLHLPETSQEYSFSLIYEYHDKAYFSSRYLIIEDGAAVQQWNENLPDGTNVLIVSNKGGDAYILCDRTDAFICVTIRNVGWDWESPGDVMTRDDMSRIARALDFSINPTPVENMEALQDQLEAMRQAQETFAEDPAAEAERIRICKENEQQDSYADLIQRIRDHEDYFTTHCNIAYENFWETMEYVCRDMNNDGQEELILGRNGHIHEIWTIQDGKTAKVIGSYNEGYLCEGNVYENYVFLDGKPYHYYFRLDDDNRFRPIMEVSYDAPNGTWVLNDFENGIEEKPISEAEANERIANYARIPLEMKPVQDYPL